MTGALIKPARPHSWAGETSTPFLRSQAMISAPRISHSHPNRLRDCQRALVTDLNCLIDRAAAMGWNRREVIAALADLLDAEPEDADGLLRAMAGYVGQPAQHIA